MDVPAKSLPLNLLLNAVGRTLTSFEIAERTSKSRTQCQHRADSLAANNMKYKQPTKKNWHCKWFEPRSHQA